MSDSGSNSDVTIFIVDDEPQVRELLTRLISGRGWGAAAFEDAQAFLDAYNPAVRGCLILDIQLPGMSGLELQRELNARGVRIPIVILTGAGDVASAREAFRAGVVDFVTKPFRNAELLDCVARALEKDASIRFEQAIVSDASGRFARLSPREREVADLLVEGKSTKEIAYQLGLSPKTVDVHRANTMKKVGVESVVDLVHLAMALKSGRRLASTE